MNDATILRIAAVFSFLSPLAILAGIPFAAELGGVGGPGPIAFADGEVLLKLAELGAAPVQVDTFALIGPVLALPAAAGWYLLLRSTSRVAAFGIVLWWLGMVFVVIQDALQLAFVSTLPTAYAGADITLRASIEVLGASAARSIDVLSFVSHIGDFGFLLVSLVMLRAAVIPKWIGMLGLLSSLVTLIAGVLAFALPSIAWLGVGVPIGIMLLLVCIAGLGFVMLREAKK